MQRSYCVPLKESLVVLFRDRLTVVLIITVSSRNGHRLQERRAQVLLEFVKWTLSAMKWQTNLPSTTLRLGEVVPSAFHEFSPWGGVAVGLGGGAGLVYVFLRGALSQMGAWKDIVVAHDIQRARLEKENGVLSKVIDDQRNLLNEVNMQLLICKRESDISLRRIEQLSVELVDVRSKLSELHRQFNGEDKITNDYEV